MVGSLESILRVIRVVICDFSKSHDEILHPERWRQRNFGEWYREKKGGDIYLRPVTVPYDK